MTFKSKWRVAGSLILVVLLLAIGLVGLGCVRGLAPIGWSGGKVDNNILFVGTREGRLVTVGLDDESLRWGEPLKASSQAGLFGCAPAMGGGGCGGGAGVAIYGTPVTSGELVYIAGYNGKIYAYNKDTLALRWVYPREGYLRDDDGNVIPLVGGLVENDGRLYFGGSDGSVFALDAVNGDPLWKSSVTTEDKIWSTPTVADDTLYIGSFDNKFYALNIADGTKKWEFTAEGAIISKPLVYEGTVYVGSFDRNFYAIDTANGAKKHQFAGQNWFWAEPVLHDGKLYVGCLDNFVYVLDAANLTKVAEFNLGSPVSSAPVIIGDSVVFASREGLIFTIDTVTNGLRQLADFEKEVNGPLAAYEDVVYVHTQELTLERVNVTNGAILRSISLESLD